MKVNFIPRGRLGNAIYRFLACSIFCILYNYEYIINQNQTADLSDAIFYNNMNNINKIDKEIVSKSYNMVGYYIHDNIYKIYKKEIINFINNNQEYYVLTDGINAGDGRYQKFKMLEIANTPKDFKKIYKNVLHIRLEDMMTIGLSIDVKYIILLLDKIKDTLKNEGICIVYKCITTQKEKEYIDTIKEFLNNNDIIYHIENNDVLTDYYIMKEAEVLICSVSTLSWAAAYFSEKIHKCYMPDYKIKGNGMTCKYPINNTILYDIKD